MKKLTFFIMLEKGFEVLKAVYRKYPDIIDTVVCSRDKNIVKDYYNEIKSFCRQKKIPFCDRLSKPDVRTKYAITISWRWMIRDKNCRLIILHDSILPKYRGFNPLVTALIKGDKEVGVTAIYAAEGYDCGDIIASSKSKITYPMKIQEAIRITIRNYSALTLKIVGYLSRGIEPSAAKQKESLATYSLWRDEEDYFIDWSNKAGDIRRFIDAVGFPYKGAAVAAAGRAYRVLQAEEVKDLQIENRTPGKVIMVQGSKPVVVCGQGLLKINEIIDESTGRTALPLKNFRTRFKGCAGLKTL